MRGTEHSAAVLASVLVFAVAGIVGGAACGSFTADTSGEDGGGRGDDGSASGSDAAGAGDAGGDPAATDGGKTRNGYRATVIADGPLGYWRLGEPAGTMKAHDETGQFDGIYVGNCMLGVTGIVANETAVHFNGTDCTVDLGDHFEFTGKEAFSIEAWAKPDSPQGDFAHVFTRETRTPAMAPDTGYAFLFDDPTTVAFERSVNAINRKSGGTTTPTGGFVHVVATYDGGTVRVYVNGTPGAVEADGNAMTAVSVHAFIGSAGDGMNAFKGDIDEVAIYGKELSAAQVAAHYAAGR